jgi:hypothetical protein
MSRVTKCQLRITCNVVFPFELKNYFILLQNAGFIVALEEGISLNSSLTFCREILHLIPI